MPRCFPRGKGLGLALRVVDACEGIHNSVSNLIANWKRLNHRARRPGSDPLRAAAAATVEAMEGRMLLSTSWFVSPAGNDNNPGTIAAPFRTIQRAANLAAAGDRVEIRAGVYHETVTPARSGTASNPIVFEAYNNENVTISGADPIGGWSSYSGAVYKAGMNWSLGAGNDQVFVDGTMINYARWPNSGYDPSHPTLATAQKITVSGSLVTLYHSGLNQPAGYWNGATVHITPGQQWVAQTATVTNSGFGWIQFNYHYINSYEIPSTGNAFYLTGAFRALDGAGEWYNSGGLLYAWMPKGDSPAYHDVEAKRRLYAFDVSNRSGITVQNLNLFAATVNSNSASSNLVVNHITARYTGQFLTASNGWSVPGNSGIVLAGPNSILQNSNIGPSAGDGVLVTGAGSRVTNNTIHDVDYSAEDAAAVRVRGSGVSVDHNTIYNAGRDGILHAGTGHKLLYNTISAVGLQTTEAGGIYDVNTNGGGTEIAYNTVHGLHSGGFGQTGIFLDNNSSGYVVHNNNVYDADAALKMNATCRNNQIYNNNLVGSQFAINSDQRGDWNGTSIHNNVLVGKVLMSSGVSQWSNSASAASGIGAGSISSGAVASASSPPPASAPDQQTPTPAAGSISGTFFYDSNKNGAWDAGEAASPLWLVYIDANRNGRYDAGDTEIRADSSGRFTFRGLAAGTYSIRAESAAGWSLTAPNPSAGGSYLVNLAAGQNVANINFGEVKGTVAGAPAPKGSISGQFWYDANADGKWDAGEQTSPLWLVYLDMNRDGVFNSGDVQIRADNSGRFTFTNLAAGSYQVRAMSAAGWTLTTPAASSGACYTINLSAGQNATGLYFGELHGTPASAKSSISGTFFYDANRNGAWDSNETYSPLWYLYIDANNNSKYDAGDHLIRADGYGRYTFTGLSAGTYVIRAATASGWQQTTPTRVVTVSAGQNITGINIGERRT